jgi:phenylalanyl-tRNA synthetase beta subunit
MRPSNIPNLLTAINLNKSKMISSGKIFEVGPIFDETLEIDRLMLLRVLHMEMFLETIGIQKKKTLMYLQLNQIL